MPTTTTLLQFALASLLLAITPGPSLVLLLAVGTDRGRRAAVATALGLAVGTSVWGGVVAAGLGALLAARPGLLDAVTVVGGAYLLWLAWSTLRATTVDEPRVATTSGALRDGLVVNLLNPNLAVFLAAVVPPFLDVGAGPVWQQVLWLTAVLVTVSTVVNVAAGLAGAHLGRHARDRIGGDRTRRVAATTYALLGVLAMAAAVVG